jgi:hypothetical protein
VLKVVVDHDVRDRFVRHVRVVVVPIARVGLPRGRLAGAPRAGAAEARAGARRVPRGRQFELLQGMASAVRRLNVVHDRALAVVRIGVIETRVEGRVGRGGWVRGRRQVRDDVGPYRAELDGREPRALGLGRSRAERRHDAARKVFG